MCANGTHYITTNSQRRAALWDQIFGTYELPVMHPTPREQERQGRAAELCYDLDTSRLTTMQQVRFASHLARVEKRPYAEALADVVSGRPFPITASSDVMVIEPAGQMSPLGFFVAWVA